jgi:hypothetical protein
MHCEVDIYRPALPITSLELSPVEGLCHERMDHGDLPAPYLITG